MIVKLIRYLMGYVSFKATGGFPERFVNLCSIHKIPLWDLQRKDGVLTAKTYVKGYKKIRPAAKKSGMRVRADEKTGAPFFYRKYKKRVGIVVGLGIFIALMSLYSNTIWLVEVEGNETLDAEAIIAVAAEYGLKQGVFAGDVDVNDLKIKLPAEIPEIAWMNVNMDSSRAVIEIRERTIAQQTTDNSIPYNVKAYMDGIITKMEVYRGQAIVKEGDSVLKGDILVSGVVEYLAGQQSYQAARATIIAQTERKIVVEIDRAQTHHEMTGKEKKRSTLSFFGLEIPLYIGRAPGVGYEIETTEKPFVLFGVEMPIGITTKVYKQYDEIPYTADRDAAEALANENREMMEEAFPDDIKIISMTVGVDELEDRFYFAFYYVCEENIAYQEAFSVEDEPETDPDTNENKENS